MMLKLPKGQKNFFKKKLEDSKLQKYWNKTIYIYIYNYAIEKYNRKKGSHDYSFSTYVLDSSPSSVNASRLGLFYLLYQITLIKEHNTHHKVMRPSN